MQAQKLLSDIAMLEVAVLKLETQTTALQWEIVHERREREVIEYGLNLNPLESSSSLHILRKSPRHIASSSGAISTARSPQSDLSEASSPSVRHNSPATPNSTLKNLLRAPSSSTVGEISEQRVSTPQTPPKSPRRGLRGLWGGQDPQPQPQSPTSPSFFKVQNFTHRSMIVVSLSLALCLRDKEEQEVHWLVTSITTATSLISFPTTIQGVVENSCGNEDGCRLLLSLFCLWLSTMWHRERTSKAKVWEDLIEAIQTSGQTFE